VVCILNFHVARALNISYIRAKHLFDLFESLIPTKGRNQGFVTLRFDDASVQQYEYALPILEKFNMHGVLAVPTKWIGDRSRLVQSRYQPMETWDKVKEFVKMGWEIASHSRYHRHDRITKGPWTKLTVKELHEEIIDSKRDIIKNLGIEPYTMVLPGITTAQNPITLREKRLICKQYSALSLSSNLKVFNRLGRNPYNLWAIPLHWSTDIFAKVEKITRISKNKAFWVIFYIHKISDDLSDPLTSMKPSQLKALVEILAADEDLNVVTIRQGVELGCPDQKVQVHQV